VKPVLRGYRVLRVIRVQESPEKPALKDKQALLADLQAHKVKLVLPEPLGLRVIPARGYRAIRVLLVLRGYREIRV
jgi:hypothetical protein